MKSDSPSPGSAVTAVTGVQASSGADFDVTSAVWSGVIDVTARPSIRARSPSSPMIGPQLVRMDCIDAQQPTADALRFCPLAAGVRRW